MNQWSMRITAYAQRLLDGLDTIDWPQPLKDSQTNWIGRSEELLLPLMSFLMKMSLRVQSRSLLQLKYLPTRPDTIFGTSFMTLAPEHELVAKITTAAQKAEVEAYVEATAKRSERDRMADVKSISGVLPGLMQSIRLPKNPFRSGLGLRIGQLWNRSCYGRSLWGSTGLRFAKHFDIPIPNIFDGVDISEEAFADKAQYHYWQL